MKKFFIGVLKSPLWLFAILALLIKIVIALGAFIFSLTYIAFCYLVVIPDIIADWLSFTKELKFNNWWSRAIYVFGLWNKEAVNIIKVLGKRGV